MSTAGPWGKTFDRLRKVLAADEEVPLCRSIVMGAVIHFLVTGEWLDIGVYLFCGDVLKNGERVIVTLPNRLTKGVEFDSRESGYSHGQTGLAAARILKS